jgi:UPF0755 protein
VTPARILPVAVTLSAVVLVALVAWAVAGTPDAVLTDEAPIPALPTPTGDEFVAVSIREGENAGDVGKALEQAGVIRSGRHFRILASLMGVEDELLAGEYEFDLGLPALTVIGRLRRGETMPLTVTIPEGLRAEEIGELLEAEGIAAAADFRRALSASYDFAFLPQDAGLEGYLFPATYGFSRAATAEDAVTQMLAAFDEQVTPEVRQEAESQGLSLHELVTLASIIEREAVKAEERPLMAGVFLNRLRQGMRLEADPTVQYAVAALPGSGPDSVAEFGWWKKALTESDLQVDSPYNTYVNAGLPPGPIANPGLASIEAVARPAETDFLYFVARPAARPHLPSAEYKRLIVSGAKHWELPPAYLDRLEALPVGG